MNEVEYEIFEDVQRRERIHWSQLFSLSKYITASLELSVLLGVLFGLFVTLLWWIELNLQTYCDGEWDDIPLKQWFPTTVPRHISVPRNDYWCAAKRFHF